MLFSIRGGAAASGDEYRVLNMPRASVYRTGAATTASSLTFSQIAWDTLEYDTDGMWDSSVPSRLICKTPGVYLVTAAAAWNGNASGFRQVRIKKTSGSTSTLYPAITTPDSGDGTNLSTAWPIVLNKYDIVEAAIRQNSGSTLTFAVASATDRLNGFTATMLSTL